LYEKKLRQLFNDAEQKAEKALNNGDVAAAASFYEQCGDILQEQAQNYTGPRRKKKEEVADEYFELADNLRGKSDSLAAESADGSAPGRDEPDETDFSSLVERFIQEADVTWSDVAGLAETKTELQESFALAAIQDKPPAVEGMHTALLYGPPGTGKSLLASAIAGSHDYTFFNVKLSQALSKYYGESGKIITELFEAARARAPSVIFFDEIDAITLSRSGDMDESSRRVLSTLLTELSGFGADNEEVLFLAATNAPWDIDQAILSRMERVIHVPLPDKTTAERIIEINTAESGIDMAISAERVAEQCVERQYSGRETKNVCKEAIRQMISEENAQLEELSKRPIDEIRSYQLDTRPLQRADFEHAFDKIDPNTGEDDIQRYNSWEDNM
jgi:SpoVK/Ycf46/Vps4 family AAA+-type ATPase